MCTHNINSNRLFYFSIKLLGAEGLVPGGDVLTSEGKGDFGAAQFGFSGGLDQHWKQMEKRTLGTR